MRPEPPAIFQAILQPTWPLRRLSVSAALAGLAYAGLLALVIALLPARVDTPARKPRSLTVTLFDAPKSARVVETGLAGGASSNAVGGAGGSGPLIVDRQPRPSRPAPKASAATQQEATALPDERPKDLVGAGAQAKQTTDARRVGTEVRESKAPRSASATAQSGHEGDGALGATGGAGGAGTSSAGAGNTASGSGHGAGVRAGAVSGTTEVLPFQDGMTRPTLLFKVDPAYTREAREANVEGLILTKCVITATGALQRCRIVRGIPMMDQAVLSALAQWRYSPVLYQGKKTAVEYLIPLRLVAP
jgi:periplasmic protein TonB